MAYPCTHSALSIQVKGSLNLGAQGQPGQHRGVVTSERNNNQYKNRIKGGWKGGREKRRKTTNPSHPSCNLFVDSSPFII